MKAANFLTHPKIRRVSISELMGMTWEELTFCMEVANG